MIEAILTIDDISSENTRAMVDYLCKKNITAVMFAVGQNVEKFYDNAIYALQNGMIVGNHSYSHPAFSSLSVEEGIKEIEKNEELLSKLYADAGVKRKVKVFRFPYGDKGGENKEAFQEYFKENDFAKLDDSQIDYYWYRNNRLNEDIDTFWTFDYEEWQSHHKPDWTKEEVFQKMDNPQPKLGVPLFEENSKHIVLMHAHDETEAVVPEYYKLFLDYSMKKGVQFVKPQFR